MPLFARSPSEPTPQATYRVLVCTDLGGDPDDIQSLYRLIHYSDILRFEGIISTPGPNSVPSADLVAHWVQRVDVDHLRARGHAALMAEADILATIRQGHTKPRPPAPGAATKGSQWIIHRANAPDPHNRPLWVLCWGSLTDVAQALHDDPGIAEQIRLYAIGSTNTQNDPASRDFVYRFMEQRCPRLWWIENGVMPPRSRDTFRGVYLGGDQGGEWNNRQFILRNIRGRGTTHGGKFTTRCGDAFPVSGGADEILKESDSASLLYLLSPALGGVGNVDDPAQESWGGQFRAPAPDRFPNYHTDLDLPAPACQNTIAKWRAAFLANWKGRWQWYGA